VDVLADVLSRTRVRGSLHSSPDLNAPWGIAMDRSRSASFHIVVRGTCILRTASRPDLQLVQGDIVLISHGDDHRLLDHPDAEAQTVEWYLERYGDVRTDGHGARTELLCGSYAFGGEAEHPVLRLLPAVLHIPAVRATARRELHAVLQLLVDECAGPTIGSSAIVDRLIDVLLIQLVRAWLEEGPAPAGWLSALQDPVVGPCLELLHDDPGAAWTLERLAAAVHVSRATLARRFASAVGDPPMAYLARLRIDRAADLLTTTERTLASIARSVGYESDFALSKAFKRTRGTSPAEHRRQHRDEAGVA
jgi:AraC-like DNA-binding protein